ncbi:MAG: hypothetical protein JO129_04345 [Candidatus Dependentiae bacterium]|nr:hypothetical protein [Candidatus Dependentiae bacterium]
MFIQKYDMYQLYDQRYSLLNKKSISNLYYLTIFLLWRFGYVTSDGVLNFVEKYKHGISFEEVDINIDDENDLVYFSESWYDYKNKPTTPEIDQLLEEENFIKLCKIGFLDYIVMTKDNFIHLLLAWDNILKQLPPFALLYLDDKDWFDIMPFQTQEEMEQFVADHTKK